MHSHRIPLLITGLLAFISPPAFAGPRPPPTPPPPLTPPPPVPTAPNRPIDQAQREYDRTTGRVVDQPTYELNQIQSPPQTDLDRIERDRDRQDLINRQSQAQELPAGSITPTAPLIPPSSNSGAVIVPDEDKQGLEADILEAVVAYERGTRQADETLSTNPAQLHTRRLQLGSQLEHRLDQILTHYSVRRLETSTTQPTR